ncbi:MAG: MutS protein msh5 [Thelocarpon superellum]|nr:MAG: MutS protein msh5 [Thelocarpon superellum]
MAVDVKDRDTVGCCYFVAREETLYFMGDGKLGGQELIDALMIYVQPTVVLLSTRVDESIFHHLRPTDRNDISAGAEGRHVLSSYLLELRPSVEFGYDAAKNRLLNLRIASLAGPLLSFVTPDDAHSEHVHHGSLQDEYIGGRGKLLRLSALIDLESHATLGCAGAILSYLQRRTAMHHLPGDESANPALKVKAVEMFSLKNTMQGTKFINADALASLQIMQVASHPASHNQGPNKGSSGSKEGLSVYGLFHHLARTPQGKCCLRKLFLRPSLDARVINDRLNVISVLLQPESQTVFESIFKHLKQVKNMKKSVVQLRKGLLGCLGGAEGGTGRTIDFEGSVEARRTLVRVGVDTELDEWRYQQDSLQSLLAAVAHEMSRRHEAQIDKVVWFAQMGFLIVVSTNLDTGGPGYDGSRDPNNPWERFFSTETGAYYKSNEMREMDEQYGYLQEMIRDREVEILHSLAQSVLEHEDLLVACSDLCGELDR